jgi:hypothetical protein
MSFRIFLQGGKSLQLANTDITIRWMILSIVATGAQESPLRTSGEDSSHD